MKKLIISAAVLGILAIAPAAFAQSTVTGTLSSGGTTSTTTGSTSLSGTVSSGNSLSGTVGSGNSLTGTVTSTSTTSSSPGGGGGTTVASNGPPAGGGGGGGGGGATIVCPNLPANLYSLPAGYELVDGVCDPIGTTTTTPGIPNTGTTVPGIPNTGAGGNAESNAIILIVSGLTGAIGGIELLRRKFAIG